MLDYSKHFVKHYQHAIETMQTEEKVALLYEKAISCMQRAMEAIEQNNASERYMHLETLSKVINGLRESIDIQADNIELAKQLNNYFHALDCLVVSIQSTRDMASCEKVLVNLRALHDAWEQKITKPSPNQLDEWVSMKLLRQLV